MILRRCFLKALSYLPFLGLTKSVETGVACKKIETVVLDVLLSEYGKLPVYVVITDSFSFVDNSDPFYPADVLLSLQAPSADTKHGKIEVNRAWHVFNHESYLQSLKFHPEYGLVTKSKLPLKVANYLRNYPGTLAEYKQFHMFETRYL